VSAYRLGGEKYSGKIRFVLYWIYCIYLSLFRQVKELVCFHLPCVGTLKVAGVKLQHAILVRSLANVMF